MSTDLKAQSEATPWRLVLPVAVVPMVLALAQLGRLHPDEVYQYLEPAMHRAFGYGVLAWEWQTGLRNWAIPGVLAWLLELCAAVGIDDPWWRRAVLALPQLGLQVWVLAAVHRFSARRVGPALARWSVGLVGLYMPLLTFAGRTMSESYSTALLAVALELLDRPGATGWRRHAVPLGAGALLGGAVVARYGSAAAVAPAMLWLLASRRWRESALSAAGGLVVAALLGWLDQATWGEAFHSFRAYYDFNVKGDQAAAQFGAEAWSFYLPWLGLLAPWAWPGFVAWFGQRQLRAWLPVVTALGYLVAISRVPHKEPRFLYPALVLLSVAAAPAALWLLAKKSQWLWLKPLAAVASLAFLLLDTPFEAQRPEQFRLEARAAHDATGFFIIPEGVWGAGGYFWLGKNIPWFTCDFPEDPRFVQAMGDPRFNRVVTWEQHGHAALLAAGFHVVEQQGKATLYGR